RRPWSSRPWPTRRRRVGGETGSVSAELVIATPLLLLLIMGVIQFALWQHATHVAQAAAQQALAVGRLQGESPAAGEAEGDAVLAQVGTGVLLHPSVAATRTAGVTTVVVTGHAESILGIFSFPVRAVASGPTEVLTSPAQTP
ncbi:MAG: TadE family protein, partial [Acidimicrobiales bacterium]